MKYYLVCFVDYKKNDNIIIKDSYLAKIDAEKRLESVALEYVKEYQGKQQAEKCQLDLTPDQILSDVTLKEGLYIRKVDETVVLYEKVNVVLEGAIWNSYDVKVNKIGLFTISEYNFENQMAMCGCNIQKIEKVEKVENTHIVSRSESNPSMLLDELKQLFMKGGSASLLKRKSNMNIKPINEPINEQVIEPVTEPAVEQVTEQIEEIVIEMELL